MKKSTLTVQKMSGLKTTNDNMNKKYVKNTGNKDDIIVNDKEDLQPRLAPIYVTINRLVVKFVENFLHVIHRKVDDLYNKLLIRITSPVTKC